MKQKKKAKVKLVLEETFYYGRFAGSIGVSGVFKRGTLQQVYERTIR